MKNLKCAARICVSVLSLLLPFAETYAEGASPGRVELIMRLLGADDPEDLDEETVERLDALLDHPLHINYASAGRLSASGLFTQYQTASILDCRARSGDILSFSELAAMDGFGEEFAEALKPFVSLDSSAAPGRSSVHSVNVANVLALRSSYRFAENQEKGSDYGYGLKYRLELGDRLELGLAANRTYGTGHSLPDAGTFYMACYGRKKSSKIVLGDYNLRYGQGVALWSGFNMDGVSYPQTFFRRPSGITPYLSFSGSGGYRGAAADFSAGHFTAGASIGIGGLKEMMAGKKSVPLSLSPAVNVGWLGRTAQASVTLCGTTAELAGDVSGGPFAAAVVSTDFRWCIKGVDLFGEAALDIKDMRPAAVAGTAFRAGENLELAFRGRCSGEECGVSAGGKFNCGQRMSLAGKEGFGSSVFRHSGTLCMDAAHYSYPKYKEGDSAWQVKVQIDYKLQVLPSLCLVFRFSERLRSAGETGRTDFRCDLKWSDGRWMGSMRMNVLYNKSVGLLSYTEGGYAGKFFTVHLRAGAFRTGSWQDRIYVYERDAPGNFNVPAYYGYGCWGALNVAIKTASWCRLYLRASTVRYPWSQPSGKAMNDRTEVKLHAVFRL